MDSQIHQLLQRPLQCWGADVCLISDPGAFTAGVQGIIGFLASKAHGIFSSEKLLILLEYMIPCISTFQFLFTSYRVLSCWALLWRSPEWRKDSWRVRCWERVFIGFLFSFSCDFHPMVEVTAWSLTSQTSILIFGNAGLLPLVHQHHIFILPQDAVTTPVVTNGLRSVSALCGLGKISPFSRDSGFCSSTAEVKMVPSALELKFNFLSAA